MFEEEVDLSDRGGVALFTSKSVWWFLCEKRGLRLNIKRVVVSHPVCLVSQLSGMTVGASISYGGALADLNRLSLDSAAVETLIVEETIPAVGSGVWRRDSEFRLIVVVQEGNCIAETGCKTCRRGWVGVRFSMSHAELGGTTSWCGRLLCFWRMDERTWSKRVVIKMMDETLRGRPGQDMRMILKCSLEGKRVPAPRGEQPARSSKRVNWCAWKNGGRVVTETLENYSLFPWDRWNSGVVTWVRTPTVTGSYVRRVIGQKEHLAMADIPEAIYRELDELDVLRLKNSVTIPIKVLQGISRVVGRMWDLCETKHYSGSKRSLDSESVLVLEELVRQDANRKVARLEERYSEDICAGEIKVEAPNALDFDLLEPWELAHGDWVASFGSTKAVKADDAEAPVVLWD